MDDSTPQKRCSTPDCDGSAGFFRDRNRSGGYRKSCKACILRRRHFSVAGSGLSRSKAYNLKKKYGLSAADYARMVRQQDGRCLCCGERPDKLMVDHCHTTRKVRGLLCNSCNVSLGYMKEDPARIRKLALYLETQKREEST